MSYTAAERIRQEYQEQCNDDRNVQVTLDKPQYLSQMLTDVAPNLKRREQRLRSIRELFLHEPEQDTPTVNLDPSEMRMAALILMRSNAPQDLALAYTLCETALLHGKYFTEQIDEIRRIAARVWDRWKVSMGMPTDFGVLRHEPGCHNPWYHHRFLDDGHDAHGYDRPPVNPHFSDARRRQYGVPPFTDQGTPEE